MTRTPESIAKQKATIKRNALLRKKAKAERARKLADRARADGLPLIDITHVKDSSEEAAFARYVVAAWRAYRGLP